MRAAFRRQHSYSYASAEETSRARSVSPRLVNLIGDLSPSASPPLPPARRSGHPYHIAAADGQQGKASQHLDCAMRTIS
jgi:hypothetical protein